MSQPAVKKARAEPSTGDPGPEPKVRSLSFAPPPNHAGLATAWLPVQPSRVLPFPRTQRAPCGDFIWQAEHAKRYWPGVCRERDTLRAELAGVKEQREVALAEVRKKAAALEDARRAARHSSGAAHAPSS